MFPLVLIFTRILFISAIEFLNSVKSDTGSENVELKERILNIEKKYLNMQSTIETTVQRYENKLRELEEKYDLKLKEQDDKFDLILREVSHLHDQKMIYLTKFYKSSLNAITTKYENRFRQQIQRYRSRLHKIENVDKCHNWAKTVVNVTKSKPDYNGKEVDKIKPLFKQREKASEKKTGVIRRLLSQPATPLLTQVASNHIAFSVVLTRSLVNLGTHHPIVYDHVSLNLGDGYNNHDGIFTVPVDGVYFFTWTVLGTAGHIGLDLIVDGQFKTASWSASPYETGTNSFIVDLKTGNAVWLSTSGHADSGRTLGDGYKNGFSGFLIYAK